MLVFCWAPPSTPAGPLHGLLRAGLSALSFYLLVVWVQGVNVFMIRPYRNGKEYLSQIKRMPLLSLAQGCYVSGLVFLRRSKASWLISSNEKFFSISFQRYSFFSFLSTKIGWLGGIISFRFGKKCRFTKEGLDYILCFWKLHRFSVRITIQKVAKTQCKVYNL